MKTSLRQIRSRLPVRLRWPFVGGVLLAAVVAAALWPTREAPSTVFKARRGPFRISVIEGGSIEAMESQVIRSQVRSRRDGGEGTKILHIVEEGYRVTEQDVADRLILVELDASAIQDRITSQEIDYQATRANLTESMKQKEVQENRNLSDIKTASLNKKFTLMDFKKYLGQAAALQILEQLDLNEASVERQIRDSQEASNSGFKPIPEAGGSTTSGVAGVLSHLGTMTASDVEALLPEIRDYDVDFSVFAEADKEELLGNGLARQELRKLQDNVLIAEAEYTLHKKAHDGAIRLNEAGYLTDNELEQKKITYRKADNALKAAKAELALYKTYDLQKNAEQFLLLYETSLLELVRVRNDALAELSDRISDLEWSRRQHQIETDQLQDLYAQLESCVIRAEHQGLVVYGDGREQWDRDEIVREGATVRERQAIITIPDMREMALTVRIHESQIKRVRVGQRAYLEVDAEPDRPLRGVVSRVAVLPDSENRRFNPDQKVYKTTITIEGMHEWLKPGMNAKAEIVVNELDDVVHFPLHALFPYGDAQACIVRNGFREKLRLVEVIDYDNRFVAVRSGVEAGEAVLLDPSASRVSPLDHPDPRPEGAERTRLGAGEERAP